MYVCMCNRSQFPSLLVIYLEITYTERVFNLRLAEGKLSLSCFCIICHGRFFTFLVVSVAVSVSVIAIISVSVSVVVFPPLLFAQLIRTLIEKQCN